MKERKREEEEEDEDDDEIKWMKNADECRCWDRQTFLCFRLETETRLFKCRVMLNIVYQYNSCEREKWCNMDSSATLYIRR